MAFCTKCGQELTGGSAVCGACGAARADERRQPIEGFSKKSFAVAVSLCGVFGTVGLHHFYLGNVLHGLFDLGLFVASIACFFSGDVELQFLGGILFALDFVHTLFVFYNLMVGRQRDSTGRLVVYPGQYS